MSAPRKSRIPIRWTEWLLAAVAAVALWQLYLKREAIEGLQRELGIVSAELQQMFVHRSSLEHDLHYYKQVALQSELEPYITLEGIDLDSVRFFLRPRDLDRPLVLYSIDPACPACIANLPFLLELAAKGPCRTQVVGVAVAGWAELEQFRRRHGVVFPVLRQAWGEAWAILPIAGSPMTVVLGPKGSVKGWWAGRLTTEAQNEIRKLLGSCLPALNP